MIAYERRASAILFNVLRALDDPRPFLLPANVCPIVPRTFRDARRQFEFVDIAEPWLEIDAARCLERLGTNAFAGVLFVRPYGSERDPSEFFSELRAAQTDLTIIDDKCLCRPDCQGEFISPLSDVTLFSTGAAKFADVDGGGFAHLSKRVAYRCATNPPDWLDLRPPDVSWSEYCGSTVDAARMAADHKSALNAIYASAIPAAVQLPVELQQWRFNFFVSDAATLVAHLFNHGLFASRHYRALGNFPVAAKVHTEIVNLFNDRNFTKEQARLATEIVVRHVTNHTE